jgi:hypothetical protein
MKPTSLLHYLYFGRSCVANTVFGHEIEVGRTYGTYGRGEESVQDFAGKS